MRHAMQSHWRANLATLVLWSCLEWRTELMLPFTAVPCQQEQLVLSLAALTSFTHRKTAPFLAGRQ